MAARNEITGTTATLRVTRKVAAARGQLCRHRHRGKPQQGDIARSERGEYAVTGTAAALRITRILAAAAGKLRSNRRRSQPRIWPAGCCELRFVCRHGHAASLLHAYKITAVAGSYTVNGMDAGLAVQGKFVAADAGSYAVTGIAASLEVGYELAAGAGSYSSQAPRPRSSVDASSAPRRVLRSHRQGSCTDPCQPQAHRTSGSYEITGTAAGLVATQFMGPAHTLHPAAIERLRLNPSPVTKASSKSSAVGRASLAPTIHSAAAQKPVGSHQADDNDQDSINVAVLPRLDDPSAHRSQGQRGDLTNAAAITMVWKRGLHGDETTETPSNISTGLYEASFVPEAGGNHYVRWDTTTVEGVTDVADEVIIPVRDSAFEDYR